MKHVQPDAEKYQKERLSALAAGGQTLQYLGKEYSLDQIEGVSNADVIKLYRIMTKKLGRTALQKTALAAIFPSIIKPKCVYVFFQRSNKMNSQDNSSYLFDTFKINAADYNCYLQIARLAVGNRIYYPETEYSYDNIERIFKAGNNYVYKQK